MCGSWWSHAECNLERGLGGGAGHLFDCSCMQNSPPAGPSLTGGSAGGVPGNNV